MEHPMTMMEDPMWFIWFTYVHFVFWHIWTSGLGAVSLVVRRKQTKHNGKDSISQLVGFVALWHFIIASNKPNCTPSRSQVTGLRMTIQVIINGKMDAANYSAYSGYAHLGAGWSDVGCLNCRMIHKHTHTCLAFVCCCCCCCCCWWWWWGWGLWGLWWWYVTPKWHYFACGTITIHRYQTCYFRYLTHGLLTFFLE